MNRMGCSFFVGFTHRVSTSSTAASKMAFQSKNAQPLSPVCTSVVPTTVSPAAAIMAEDAGRSP